MSIKAFRGGASTPYWSADPSPVKVSSRRASRHNPKTNPAYVSISFGMPSKGGGETVVKVEITPDSFLERVKPMFETDESATIRVMGELLRSSENVTIKACGEILLDQSKAELTADFSQAKGNVVGLGRLAANL